MSRPLRDKDGRPFQAYTHMYKYNMHAWLIDHRRHPLAAKPVPGLLCMEHEWLPMLSSVINICRYISILDTCTSAVLNFTSDGMKVNLRVFQVPCLSVMF